MFHGFLQAGGGSTRFGTDKALVRLGGKTMLQRTGELLSGVCEEVRIVAPAAKYGNEAWPVIADQWPGEGPLGGILSALDTIQNFASATAWALIVSCDMPFLTQEFLVFLRDCALQSSAHVVAPRSSVGLEPLCACWRADAAAAIRNSFDAGTRKVTEAMKRLPMEVLDEPVWKRFDSDNRLFWNMNTPDDYEAARRILETENR
ncbi:MAG: molybdenum cofactor guanylyltransferase [Candidatus Acidiferrum sp.]